MGAGSQSGNIIAACGIFASFSSNSMTAMTAMTGWMVIAQAKGQSPLTGSSLECDFDDFAVREPLPNQSKEERAVTDHCYQAFRPLQ